jgi:hypothetical protein
VHNFSLAGILKMVTHKECHSKSKIKNSNLKISLTVKMSPIYQFSHTCSSTELLQIHAIANNHFIIHWHISSLKKFYCNKYQIMLNFSFIVNQSPPIRHVHLLYVCNIITNICITKPVFEKKQEISWPKKLEYKNLGESWAWKMSMTNLLNVF